MSIEKLAKNVPFNFVNGTLSFFANSQQYFVGKEDARMKAVIGLLNSKTATEDELINVMKQSAIENYVGKTVVNDNKAYVKDGEIYYNGEIINSVLSLRIKECMKFGLPFDHMLRFMENISANPSYQSQKELFDFLSNKSLPITTDGCFLGYKAVRNDWMDKFSGKIFNGVGTTVKMIRPKVDDDRRNECSFGLHVGAIPYVKSYGSESGDRIVYVKVNPKDVVSVPLDHNAQKIRVCEYLVMEEYKGELDKSPVYNNNLEGLGNPMNNDDWDDDWDDEEFDEEDEFEPTYYDGYEEYDDEDEDEDDDWWEDGDDYDLNGLYSNSVEDNDEYGCGLNSQVNVSVQKPDDNILVGSPSSNLPKYTQTTNDFGIKSNGQKFWNYRKGGKFAKKDQ